MNSFSREKNYIGRKQVVVGTDTGQFVISPEENGKLYIGFNGKPEAKDDVTFTITRESDELFMQFDKLIEDFSEAKRILDSLFKKESDKVPSMESESISWKSDDFVSDEQASSIEISKKDVDSIDIKFHRSSSKDHCNSYFVAVSPHSIRYGRFGCMFMKLYNELVKETNIKTDHLKNSEGQTRERVKTTI